MGATSTFATEYGRLQGYCGDSSAGTLVRLKEMVNDAHKELCGLGKWKWLWYEGVLSVQASYSTGTVSAAAAASAFTGSGTDFTTVTRTNLEIEVVNERYEVPNTGGTLNATTLPISRSTIEAYAAGSTFVLFQRKFALAARMRGAPVFYTSKSPRMMLRPVSAQQYEIEASQPVISLSPGQIITMGPNDSSGYSTVKVWPVPSGPYSIYYEGFQEPATLTDDAGTFLFDEGMLPVFRHLALSKLWAYRNDPRLSAEIQLYKAALDEAKNEYLWDDGMSDQMNLDPFTFGDDRMWRETPPRFGMNWWD